MTLQAQPCLTAAALRQRMQSIKNDPSLTPAAQLKALLHLDSQPASCPWRSDSTNEILLRRIGNGYNAQADYTNAALYYSRAIDVINNNYNSLSIRRRQLAADYYYLSTFYDALRNMPEKRKAEDHCIDISLRLHMAADAACLRCLYARVEYCFGIGDYHKCIDDADLCEKLSLQYAAASTGADHRLAVSLVSGSRGWTVEALLRLGDFETAGKLLSNKAAEYKKNGLVNYLGLICVQLAEVQLHKRNHTAALAYFNQALQYEKAAGNRFNYKQTLKTIGQELYFDYFNDAAKALACYRQALACTVDTPPTLGEAVENLSILDNMANAWLQTGRYDSAFACFRRAFGQVKPGSDENSLLHTTGENIDTYSKIHYLAALIIDNGDAWRKNYAATRDAHALAEAARIYRVADQLLGRINMAQSDLKSRLFWRYETRRLYEHAVNVCFLRGNTADAFYFFEKSRAVLLNGQLLEQRLQDGDTIALQGALTRRLLQYKNELGSLSGNLPRYTAIKEQIFALQRRLDSLGRQIKDRNPLYYQGFLGQQDTLLADARSNALANHQALLEIFYGDSVVYTLLLTRTHSYIDTINKKTYDGLLDQYLALLGNSEQLNKHFADYIQTAHQLCQLIFHGHLPPQGRMIVSPDGRPFPLEALVVNKDPAAPQYLLQQYALSYTYSARYLQNDFTSSGGSAAGNFLGVAPVSYPPRLELGALEGSGQSLHNIGAYFGRARNLVAGDATKDQFRRLFSNYRIIQLYTHSCDSSARKEPVIYFADSALYLSDLVPENKPVTQLIVLSACQTGNGRFYSGEGVFSFNRGFAALGIPSSVSNLWSVNNTSTYRITELFYKYLADHLPPDLALQQAKLDFIKSGNDMQQLPCYWAASILMGKTDPIAYNKPLPWIWIIAGLLLLCLPGWVIARRASR